MANSAAPSSRNSLTSTPLLLSRQDDGADERSEQEHRYDLEGDEVGREDRIADRGRRLERVVGEPVVAEGVDEGVAEHAGERAGDDRADGPVAGRHLPLGANWRASQHDSD